MKVNGYSQKSVCQKPLTNVLGYIRGEGVHECYVDDGGYWHGLSFYGNPRVIYWMAMPEFEEET